MLEMEVGEISILIIEDGQDDFILLKRHLGMVLSGAILQRATCLAEAREFLALHTYNIVLLDLSLPDSKGDDAISEILKVAPNVPVVVLTGNKDLEIAKSCLKSGVQDYLLKDEITPLLLLKSIGFAIERSKLLSQVISSKENYTSIFDNNPVPLFLYDPFTYQILVVNKACGELYFYPEADLLKLTFMDLLVATEKKRMCDFVKIEKPGISGPVRLGEWRHLRSDGKEIDVDVTTHDFKLGLRSCRLAVLNNVSEVNSAKLRLQMSENKFRSMVQSGSDLIVILDKNGRYVYQSPNIVKVFGYSQEFLNGKSAFDLIHKKDLPQLLSDLEKLSEKLSFPLRPYRIKDSGGNWRWIGSIVTNLLNDPSVQGIVINSSDITDKKKQEDEKTLLINELTQKNADLTQFAYITSHNLRAPITNLLSILELFSYANVQDQKVQLFFEMFRKSTIQLDNTINDLIKILVIRRNTILELEKIRLEDIFSRIANLLSSTISQANAEINIDFSESPYLVSNSVYIESIFMNLLTNSIKYRDPERRLVINAYSKRSAKNTRLYFEDNGLGIDLKRN